MFAVEVPLVVPAEADHRVAAGAATGATTGVAEVAVVAVLAMPAPSTTMAATLSAAAVIRDRCAARRRGR